MASSNPNSHAPAPIFATCRIHPDGDGAYLDVTLYLPEDGATTYDETLRQLAAVMRPGHHQAPPQLPQRAGTTAHGQVMTQQTMPDSISLYANLSGGNTDELGKILLEQTNRRCQCAELVAAHIASTEHGKHGVFVVIAAMILVTVFLVVIVAFTGRDLVAAFVRRP